MQMIAIACVDAKNGIGKDGNLLINIKEDMRHFRETTKNSIVVMGRKTLFSFKDRAPLKNRINIVFTNNKELYKEYESYENIYFVASINELKNIISKYKDKKVFLIGGAKIYNDLINECDEAIITRLNKSFPADSYFPDLSEHGFIETSKSETYTDGDINFQFITYKKVK